MQINNELSPIALFVFNRLDHTRRTVEALQKNILAPESDLIIFSDGAKNTEESKEKVFAVREYLKNINGFKSVKIVLREKNFGLAESIISGVSEIINQYGRIIVLEDDMITSPHFLQYMNDALGLYNDNQEVISIHAYLYPVKKILPETFFLRGADCWGWATWKRGWELFEPDGKKLLAELENKKLTYDFDFSGSYPYTQMLRNQIEGKNSSWAIRWYAAAYLKSKLTLYPGKSLIDNIGSDGSGTHGGSRTNRRQPLKVGDIKIQVEKIELRENEEARLAITNYFRSKKSFWRRFLKKIKDIF